MRSLLLALILGAASAFAFQPVGWWPLMPLAFAALCEMIARAPSLRRALVIGWGFGVGQFAVGLNWIATAFTFQAAMPPALGWVAVVLLSLYLAVYPMLAAGLAWRFGKDNRLALVLALAGAWAITEWLRGTMFTGFPWNPLGVTLVDTVARPTATWIGTYGLSAVTVFLGALLWLLWKRNWRGAGSIFASLVILLAGAGFTAQLGSVKGPLIDVVQPNIGQQDKWTPGFGEIAARRLAALSLKASGPRPIRGFDDLPDNLKPRRLLLWPEAAVTDPLQDDRIAERPFADFQRKRAAALIGQGEYLLTGGLAIFSKDGRVIDGAANSIFVLGQGGTVIGRYDKAHLVPYGEYLPMRPLLSSIGLSRLAPGDIDFNAGPGPRTLALPGWGKVGFQLCYEIVFSGEVVDRRNRPDFIFNPSNDAWFGRWGPPQHLAQARLRAAEEGLPVVRSTPTGISVVIDRTGMIVDSLPWHAAGVIQGELPPPTDKPTPFARFGNTIPLALGFLLLIAAIALGRSHRYRADT